MGPVEPYSGSIETDDQKVKLVSICRNNCCWFALTAIGKHSAFTGNDKYYEKAKKREPG